MVIFHMLVTSWGTQVEEFENQHEETLEMMSWGNSCGLWIEIYLVSWGIGGLVTVARSAWWACLTIDNLNWPTSAARSSREPNCVGPCQLWTSAVFFRRQLSIIQIIHDHIVQIIYLFIYRFLFIHLIHATGPWTWPWSWMAWHALLFWPGA